MFDPAESQRLDRLLADLARLPDFLEGAARRIARLVEAAGPEVWNTAIEEIAASPRYAGLTLKPRVGLMPIGPDSDSGLWEFAHVLSGEVPRRGPYGRLQVTSETGVVLVLLPGGSFLMARREPTRPSALSIGSVYDRSLSPSTS